LVEAVQPILAAAAERELTLDMLEEMVAQE
jgi:hypothetical protein